MENKEVKNRRTFFSTIGKSAALGFIVSALPLKFFTSVSKAASAKIKVNIHPSAVKRIK